MRSKTKPARDTDVPNTGSLIGIAWYRPEQWSRLLNIAADRESLEDTYEEWLADATRVAFDLAQRGFAVRPVEVDVVELARWCKQQGCPLNGEARARFVTEKLEHNKR